MTKLQGVGIALILFMILLALGDISLSKRVSAIYFLGGLTGVFVVGILGMKDKN